MDIIASGYTGESALRSTLSNVEDQNPDWPTRAVLGPVKIELSWFTKPRMMKEGRP